MSSIEFILDYADRQIIFNALRKLRLLLILNVRRESKQVLIDDPSIILEKPNVSAYALRKSWIYGKFETRALVNSVTGELYYDLSPRVNFSPISLSFYLRDRSSAVLGFGDIDVHNTWSTAGGTLMPTPDEVLSTYRELRVELSEGGKKIRSKFGTKVIMMNALTKINIHAFKTPHDWLNELMGLHDNDKEH